MYPPKISKTENIPNLLWKNQLLYFHKNNVKQSVTTTFPTEIYRACVEFLVHMCRHKSILLSWRLQSR